MISTPLSTSRVVYQHRQTGWMMLALACLPFVCLGFIWLVTPAAKQSLPTPLLPGLLVVAIFVGGCFSSLSVVITRDHLAARFGIGLIRKTVALADIVHVEVWQTRWYEGWGIHWTRRGTLYNVAGFDAIRIGLANGKHLMIGSDEASRLVAAIQRAIADRRVRVPRAA